VGFVIDNLRLPQVEQCKLEKEEMHDEESKTFCLEASKNEIVPYKDPKNDDYRLLKDDKVSNYFPLSNLSFQNVGKFFLTFLPGVVVCAACEVQFY
jgi:hypothetical protein